MWFVAIFRNKSRLVTKQILSLDLFVEVDLLLDRTHTLGCAVVVNR